MSIVTSATLVQRLKQTNDNEAWDQFYQLYSPLIVGFARQHGCSESASKDVLQETMCQLLQYLQRFDYDPRRGQFRSYLLRIVMSRISRYMSRNPPTYKLGKFPGFRLDDIPDPHSSAPWDDFEMQWKKSLMRHALSRVRQKVKPLTWESFEGYVLQDGKSADEVASELSINKNMVYQHKNRVIELLKQEIRNLENEVGDAEVENLALENCNEDTAKILFQEKPNLGDIDHFKFLRQSVLENPTSKEAFAQFLIVDPNKNHGVKLTDNFSVGSGKQNQLCLQSPYISRNHCFVIKENEQWVLKDLNSANGVYINNIKILIKALVGGDIIQIGDRVLIFLDRVDDTHEDDLYLKL